MICAHCEAELDPADRAPQLQNADMHYYCLSRGIVGSVGHQLGKCSCHGGHYEDPPGLTTQQAAIAAYFLNLGRHNPAELSKTPNFTQFEEFDG